MNSLRCQLATLNRWQRNLHMSCKMTLNVSFYGLKTHFLSDKLSWFTTRTDFLLIWRPTKCVILFWQQKYKIFRLPMLTSHWFSLPSLFLWLLLILLAFSKKANAVFVCYCCWPDLLLTRWHHPAYSICPLFSPSSNPLLPLHLLIFHTCCYVTKLRQSGRNREPLLHTVRRKEMISPSQTPATAAMFHCQYLSRHI